MEKRRPAPKKRTFDAQAFLDTAGLKRTIANYSRGDTVYSQGDSADHVYYIQDGGVRLSVLSKSGREAVLAMLGSGEFFGESCLAGRETRMGTATAVAQTTILAVEKAQMVKVMHEQSDLSELFLTHVLARNIRIEEDLVDQLFNSSEKRLARALLLLAQYGKDDGPIRTVPKLSQEILAEMVGTTRSRVNFFMNKFRKLGFIEYNGRIEVKKSLLTVVLHD